MSTPICPYCYKPSKLVGGDVIYPHRPDLASKQFYLCEPCEAYVGCHEQKGPNGRPVPLGSLAGERLRAARNRAHAAFDPLWRGGAMTRSAAYAWLREQLGTSKSQTHIALFDADQCAATVVAVLKRGAS